MAVRASTPPRDEESRETSPLLATRDESPERHPLFMKTAMTLIVAMFVIEIGDYMLQAVCDAPTFPQHPLRARLRFPLSLVDSIYLDFNYFDLSADTFLSP